MWHYYWDKIRRIRLIINQKIIRYIVFVKYIQWEYKKNIRSDKIRVQSIKLVQISKRGISILRMPTTL